MIGYNIKNIRESKGLGINELARKINCNANYISALERNEKTNPSLLKLEQLANALDVSIGDFFKTEPITIQYKFQSDIAIIEFLLKQPIIIESVKLNINKLSNKEIKEVSEELLKYLKLLSFKYKK